MGIQVQYTVTEESQTQHKAAPSPRAEPVHAPGSTVEADSRGARADLAHELRTSLAVITLLSGNLDLLYERLDDRERRKMIRDIRKHTQRLNELIANVLALVCEQDSGCL